MSVSFQSHHNKLALTYNRRFSSKISLITYKSLVIKFKSNSHRQYLKTIEVMGYRRYWLCYMELEPKIRNYHIRDSNHIKLSYPTTLYNKQQMTVC